jgi:hypothetical protein
VAPAAVAAVSALAAVAGCGPHAGTDGGAADAGAAADAGDGGGSGSDAAALVGPLPTAADCPPAPPEIGTPGDFGDDVFDLAWRWSEADATSWAPFVYVTIPADAVSVAVVVDGGEAYTGFGLVEMAGVTLVDRAATDATGWGGDPFYHFPAIAGAIVIPMDETVLPAPGCFAILPVVDGADTRGETGHLHVVSRRGTAAASALIDLNLFVVGPTTVTTAELDEAVQVASALWAAGGVGMVGQVRYLTAPGTGLVATAGPDIDALRATDPGGDPRAVSVFFIDDFSDEAGTLGLAAGIPGPVGVSGTASSGVVLSILSHVDATGTALDTTLLGETMAHEVAHQLGLFHSTEADGLEHDFLPDTPECTPAEDTDGDGFVSAEECMALDGANLMFWIAGGFSQDQLSPIQADVLRASPVAH